MTEKALVVIASPGLSVGFELAGLEVHQAADGVAAAKQIVRLVDEGHAGIVVIDQTLYGALPDEMKRSLQRSAMPVVIPVPGPDWIEESSAHEYIVDILRRAIGYRVRLQ